MVYLGALILILSIVLILNDKLHILDLGILNNTIANDYTSFSSKLCVGLLSLICLLMIHPYLISQRLNQFEYVLLFLFSVLGLFLLCSSNDLITAYLAIELQTLSFYVLAAFNRNSTFSMDAGIKYFILGSFSSGLFLFGSSLLYGISGSVNFSELKDLFMHTMPEIKTGASGNLMVDSFSELYYHSLLMSQFKYDLSLSLGSNFEVHSLKNFSLIKEELLNFNLNILIDQVCVFNTILSKYNCILLSLILNLKDYELGFLLYELYNFKDLAGLSDDSGFLMILSICEITKSYLSTSLVSLNIFDASLIQFSLLFILISLFFKLSIVPFHAWAPDVYEGSPSSSTFFFAVLVVSLV